MRIFMFPLFVYFDFAPVCFVSPIFCRQMLHGLRTDSYTIKKNNKTNPLLCLFASMA